MGLAPIALIYLKGINIKELKNIIKFIYFWEVEIDKDLLDEFLKLANDLEIEGLKKAPNTVEKGVDTNLPFVSNQAKNDLKVRQDIVGETANNYNHEFVKTDLMEENLDLVKSKSWPTHNIHSQKPICRFVNFLFAS